MESQELNTKSLWAMMATGVLSSCLVTALACAEPIVFTKFQKASPDGAGVVKLNGTSAGMGTAAVTLDIVKPVKLKMKIRRAAVSDKPGHFGVELLGGDGFRAHFYSHDGANFISALHQGKTKINDKGERGAKELFPVRADAPWGDVTIYVQPKLAELHVAGEPRGIVNANLLPLKRLSVYGYHNDVEVKDVEWETLPEVEPVSTDPNPSFQAAFDDGLVGMTTRGELAPTMSANVELVPGVSGQAVRLAAKGKKPKDLPQLEYDVKGLFADHGAVMFWMKSDWDGAYTGDMPPYPMLAGLDATGKGKLNIAMTWWISFALGRTGTLKSEELKRDSRWNWRRGDWNHVAVVWSDGGWCKAYLNGLPYQQPFGFNGKILTNLDQKAITRLVVGTGSKASEAAFDELKIYKRPLSNGEVYDEYRKFMPVDLLVDRSTLDAGKPQEVVVLAAPGGYYMHPMPADRPLSIGRVEIKMQLESEDGKVVAEKNFSLNMSEPTELRMPVEKLAAGKYRLKCAVSPGRSPLGQLLDIFSAPRPASTVQRSFELQAYQPKEPMAPGNDDIQLGELIFSKDIKDGKLLDAGGVKVVASPLGEYLEGGDHKENRFSFEVPFPEKYLDGRPVMLEIEWPDDKPRSMGLYMYPESKKANHRDRLGGGVQSGVEFPLTGKMQKTKYLFHPGLKSYLFEARTMVGKFPAAVAGFRVYAIKNERLPKLAVNYPENLPPRRFGHRDEDETADQNLGWDYKGNTAQTMTERLLDYLDYTGQNAWQYPFMRYTGYNIAMEGTLHTLYPGPADTYRYMIDAFKRRGKTTIGGIDLFTLPEMKMLPDETEEQVKRGWTLTKFDAPPVQPNQYTKPNHANPEVRAMIASHVKETARRFDNVPGFDGVNMTTQSMGFYSGLDDGYDDYTLKLFSKETGVDVAAKGGAERHEFLTQEPQLSAWRKWRDEQSVKLYRQIREEMDDVDPGLKLYLNVSATPSPELAALYDELRTIKGLQLVPLRFCTDHRHRMHWGRPPGDGDERLYAPAEVAKLMNGTLGFVDSYPSYFESFNGSLKNDVYCSYFQNADVKPFGRYFLKELAFAVAAMDAQRVLIGAQPLGTWGRDVEAREFAKAYCALPALPFENAQGAQAPVTVRYLNTEKGSYLYAVSMLWGDCATTLSLSSPVSLKDLSTGEMVANGRIKLKPFELRSFYAADPQLKVTAVKTVVPGGVADFYRGKLGGTQQALDKLAAEKIDCAEAVAALATMRTLLAKGQFAELHRLLFSLAVAEVMDKADNFKNIAEQAAMVRRGHYAVNCGSFCFYKAKNGTLFFPDRPLGKGDYGYVGAYNNVVRDTEGIKADDPELYLTEAYSVDAYKFKVPPGDYKVRLYFKAGYKKGFKPDIFVFNVDVQGKRALDNFDLVTACDSDFSRTLIKEIRDVKVVDGSLEIRFGVDSKHDPSVKMVNAIEVIRQ